MAESYELDIVGSELFDDGIFVGGRHCNAVEVVAQLVRHGILIRYGGRSRMRIQRGWLDTVDGWSGVCSTEEVASFVGGALLAFDSELGCVEGCSPCGPVFGAGGEDIPVWALFWETDG